MLKMYAFIRYIEQTFDVEWIDVYDLFLVLIQFAACIWKVYK